MAQIIEDYCSFETAKLLKEKGFDAPCLSYFWTEENGANISYCETPFTNQQLYSGQTLRPTLQMAMKWLREKNWFICIIPLAFYCGEKACKFGYNIWADDNLEIDEFDTPKFNTYEEATESAIKYCLENLI